MKPIVGQSQQQCVASMARGYKCQTGHGKTESQTPRAGMSNLWASGGHIAYMSNRAEGRMKF